MIIALELQNEKYRNELYELGETVNKILDKTKLPQNHKAPPTRENSLICKGRRRKIKLKASLPLKNYSKPNKMSWRSSKNKSKNFPTRIRP